MKSTHGKETGHAYLDLSKDATNDKQPKDTGVLTARTNPTTASEQERVGYRIGAPIPPEDYQWFVPPYERHDFPAQAARKTS